MQESLGVVLVVEDNAGVTHGIEELLGMGAGEIVHAVKDLVV